MAAQIPPDEVEMAQSHAPEAGKASSIAKVLSPKPAELITLPSHMACHDHSYTQIVIGLKGQAEFEVRGMGNIVGPGQGCVVTSGSGSCIWWCRGAIGYSGAQYASAE